MIKNIVFFLALALALIFLFFFIGSKKESNPPLRIDPVSNLQEKHKPLINAPADAEGKG